jgi:hypothetical protein
MVTKSDLLKLAKEFNQIADEDFAGTEKKISQNPQVEKIKRLREESISLWQQKKYDQAIVAMRKACQLEPLLSDELKTMELYQAQLKKTGKVNFKKSIKKYIFPVMEMYKFEYIEKLSYGSDFAFQRKYMERQQDITIGRKKFGQSIYFRAGKESKNGEYIRPDPGKLGLGPGALEYLNQQELDESIQKVIKIFEEKLIPWFDEG